MNGVEVMELGWKLLNSGFIGSCAVGLNSFCIFGANGLLLMVPWKPLFAAKGLNWGQNIEVLSAVLNGVVSVFIV